MKTRRILASIALVATAGISLAACEVPEDTTSATSGSTSSLKSIKKQKRKADRALDELADSAPAKSTETSAQENARESAEYYLDYSAFSRSGLIKQLKFEGFSKADATYAIDAVSPDWNKQAVKSAKDYMDYSFFRGPDYRTSSSSRASPTPRPPTASRRPTDP